MNGWNARHPDRKTEKENENSVSSRSCLWHLAGLPAGIQNLSNETLYGTKVSRNFEHVPKVRLEETDKTRTLNSSITILA